MRPLRHLVNLLLIFIISKRLPNFKPTLQTSRPKSENATSNSQKVLTNEINPTCRYPQNPITKKPTRPAIGADGVYRINFGKTHQGKTLAECPPSYVSWLITAGVWKGNTELRKALQDRETKGLIPAGSIDFSAPRSPQKAPSPIKQTSPIKIGAFVAALRFATQPQKLIPRPPPIPPAPKKYDGGRYKMSWGNFEGIPFEKLRPQDLKIIETGYHKNLKTIEALEYMGQILATVQKIEGPLNEDWKPCADEKDIPSRFRNKQDKNKILSIYIEDAMRFSKLEQEVLEKLPARIVGRNGWEELRLYDVWDMHKEHASEESANAAVGRFVETDCGRGDRDFLVDIDDVYEWSLCPMEENLEAIQWM